MASMMLRAPFSVQINGNRLVVNQVVEGESRTLCSLSLGDRHSFFMRDGKVVCLCTYGQNFVFDTATFEDAHVLLGQLNNVYSQHANKELADVHAQCVKDLEAVDAKHADELARESARHAEELALQRLDLGRLKTMRRAGYLLVGVMIVLGGLWLIGKYPEVISGSSGASISEIYSRSISPVQPLADAVTSRLPQPPYPVLKPIVSTPVAADDGWSLPAAIRATLPEKLHKAAERKLFTVDYSAGHARTLYVFSDPSCPNCQRLEPALNALSDAFNVVVFPIPVIGKEKSITAITPVLCRPPEQRKAAWDALFDPVPEGLSLGPVEKPETAEQPASEGVDSNAAQAGECEVAEKALGINQVAYQAYRIPGTPWAISDDGRYVSQALLRDPLKLQAFLDQPQPALSQDQEVSDARQ